MHDEVIELQGVRHVYRGGRVALDDVNLTIGTGLFGLLGSNGAGKSTLMRIVCTLLEPTEGKVSVAGFDSVRERHEVRKLIGYLPQAFGAWRKQRVVEVVDVLARLSGMTDAGVRKARVHEVIDSVGLGQVADRKVKKLSGGMLRRLGVAQALVHEPRILIVDEPTVGLDPEERIRFRQLMTDLARDRIIVLSTHIVADLGSGCGDLAIIDKGRLLFHGAPADLIENAQGKVLEVSVAPSDEAEAAERMEVVRRRVSSPEVRLRGVMLDGTAPEKSVPATDITLEEAYLAFMIPHGLSMDDDTFADTAAEEATA